MNITEEKPQIQNTPPIEIAPLSQRQNILEELLNRIISTPKMSSKPAHKKKYFAPTIKKDYSPASYFKSYYSGSGEQLQVSHQSRPNRYPKIMESAKKLKPNAKKILSFGCSTGEETTDLLKTFPDADLIVGVDLDHYSIQTARRNNKSSKVFFTDEIEVLGQFDVITCLNTCFCLETPINKERWLKVLSKVERHIAPDGVCMVYTSDHDPAEIFTTDKYEYVNVWTRKHNKRPDGPDYYCGYYRRKTNAEQAT